MSLANQTLKPPIRWNPDRISANRWYFAAGVIAVSIAVWLGNLTIQTNSKSVSTATGPATLSSAQANLSQATSTGHKIVGQGRIQPWGGIVNVVAAPGQRIEKILVKPLDLVRAGETELAITSTQMVLQRQVDLADAQIADAQLEWQQKKLAAELNFSSALAAQKTAQMNLKQARSQTDLTLEEQGIANAETKLKRLRAWAADPKMQKLVTSQQIDDQDLELRQAKLKLDLARRAATDAVEAATLAEKNSALQVNAAQKNLEMAEQALAGTKTLQASKALVEEQLRGSRILAPQDGTVLRCFVKPGEAIATTPLMLVGNLERMECIAEISDRLIGQVKVGQLATLHSPALARAVQGKVVEVGWMVGPSALPDPNPLAMVDRRTVEVRIEIAQSDVGLVTSLINLQVSVEIDPQVPVQVPSP